MKINIIFVLFLFGPYNFILGQNIIDLEIDSIHCQDSSCFLFNLSSSDKYICSIENHELGRDRYSFAIDCYFNDAINQKITKPNQLKLLRFNRFEKFKDWIGNKKFKKNRKFDPLISNENVQFVNYKYAIISETTLDSSTLKAKQRSREVYELVPIRINKEYFIGGLIDKNNYDIEHLIFPTKDGKGLFYNNNHIYQPTSEKIELNPWYIYDILNTYRIRGRNGKYTITSSYSLEPLIKNEFDEILITSWFIITKSDDQISIYDPYLEMVNIPDIQAAYSSFKTVQIIINNEVKWLTKDLKILDTLPPLDKYIGCGSVPSSEKKIEFLDNKFVESVSSNMNRSFPYDTEMFDFELDVFDIRFLTNRHYHFFMIDCYNQYFCHNTDLYYFKSKSGKEGLFKRINEKEEKIEHVRNDGLLSEQERWDSANNLKDSLSVTYRNEIVFEGIFEEFKIQGYNTPIVFKQNNLYGVYPQTVVSNYKSIGPFIGHLAEITFANGNKGWIDLKGNEILHK